MQQCYICACLKNGKSVKLRQSAPYSAIFVDEDGNSYHTTEVAFTNEQLEQTARISANANDECDKERELRMRLRYDIFSLLYGNYSINNGYYSQCDEDILDDMLRRTEKIFDELYGQDAKFTSK